MKSVLTLSLLIIGTFSMNQAHATPAVGDTASYDITIVDSGKTSVVQGVESITAINASSDQISTHMNILQSGNILDQSDDSQSLSQTAQLENILALCPQLAGSGAYDSATLQTITVPAGTFNTCHLVKNGSIDLNLANVPFSIVKGTQTQNGNTVIYNLTSFKKL